jgi:hypothetical protein
MTESGLDGVLKLSKELTGDMDRLPKQTFPRAYRALVPEEARLSL